MELVKIKSVKEIKSSSKKYDIKTKTGNFFANGILVHNCDGQSLTAIIKNGIFYLCSRSQCLYKGPIKKAINIYHKGNEHKFSTSWEYCACKYDLPKVLSKYKFIVLQAESCGPGVQKNKLGLKEPTMYVFNIKMQEGPNGLFYSYNKMKEICDECGFETVPFIEICEWKWGSVAELESYSKGNYSNGSPREGIVIRAFEGDYTLPPERGMSNQWSIKCINPDFRLKYED